MKLSRRDFLHSAAAFSAIGMMPRFLAHAAENPANAVKGFKDDRVLVVVQLGGGNDGLNAVVPYGDDAYYRARPTIGLKENRLLRINDHLAFSDKLEGLMRLYDRGDLALVQGVGYPNPNRSHFRSMEIWHTASSSDEFLGYGWVGRYFDNNCSGSAVPQVGLAVDAERPQAFDGEKGFGIATTDPGKFGWDPGGLKNVEAHFEALNTPGHGAANPTLDFLRHTTTSAMASAAEVRQAADKGKVEAAVRGRRTTNQLDMIAGLIRGGLDTRIYYVSTGGFDTHTNQLNAQDRLLDQVSTALYGFQQQLEKDGTADRVVTMVFSEFGRRVGENASGGTDHGTAAPLFLVGKGINPGLYGETPSLTDLDDGDLKHNVDFRTVYASLLGDWFEADPTPVLNGDFGRIPIIGA
jgi:uncharacterized protein (DUF1501 family)